MKKIISALILLMLVSSDVSAQSEIRASMGINMTSYAGLRDYINGNNFAPSYDQMPAFNSMIEFAGEFGYELTESSQLGLELAYTFTNFYYPGVGFEFDLKYDNIMPSLMYYHIIKGKGYKFKFGGGIGPRFLVLSQRLITLDYTDYSSTGVGIVGKIDGITALSEKVFAYIGADLRFNMNGTPESDNGNTLDYNQEATTVNAFGAGIKLGVTYQF